MATKQSSLPKELLEFASAFPITAIAGKADDGTIWVRSEELPGCYAAGENLTAAFDDFKQAVFEYFDVPQKYRKPSGLVFSAVNIPDNDTPASEPILTDINKAYAFA